ncbi:MAG: DUF1533 domain-containing protein [Clostridiales bacterium]|nr:DUF1533 domain-containing protein [Clostridiales bacterium]
MYKNTYIYNIKVVSDKAAYEKVGEYKVEIVEENGIRTVKSTVVINGTELESNQVLYNSESLLPIKSQVFTKFGDMDINIECHYKKNSIELVAKTPKGIYKKKLKNRDNIYDNLQVYDLVSKLDFTNEQRHKINILNIKTSIVEEYEISYCCLEEVRLGDKVYSCSRLSLSKVIDCTEKRINPFVLDKT